MEMIHNITSFWFGEEEGKYQDFWFDQSKDQYIILHFSELEQLCCDNDNYNSPTYHSFYNYNKDNKEYGKLALIILFDQFTRSIYRNTEKYNKNDEKAFQIAKYFIENEKDFDYPLSHRIFMLMPYRHQKDSDLLDFVLQRLEEYEKELGPSSLLSRFRKATHMSYTNLNDRIFRYMGFQHPEFDYFHYFSKNILDKICETYEKTTLFPKNDIFKNKIYNTIEYFVNNNKIKNIGISLSGGVDSMVIAYVLRLLQINKKIDGVYAVHIEYINREESKIETEFISSYCAFLDIPLYVRLIDYMSRDSVDRDFYEEETKKVRFHTYRFLSKKYSIEGWCLGHHRGDISENVVMNICNGRDLLDLKVMNEVSYQFGTTLFRPLLKNTKEEIYHFSETFSIPYLKNTTPEWSCRGILRNKVMVDMEQICPNIKNVLVDMGNQSEQWKDLVEQFVLLPIKNSIIFCGGGGDDEKGEKNKKVIIEIKKEYLSLPYVVWVKIFLYIFHNSKKCMISKKNLLYFLKTLHKNMDKSHEFMFSNGTKGFFEKGKDNQVLLSIEEMY